MQSISDIIGRFETYIIDPLLLMMFAAGFFLFVFGLVEFLMQLNKGGEQSEGKNHIVWGIVGMLIMVSVYGIINLLNNTFDLQAGSPNINSAQNINTGASFFGS